MTSSKNTVFIVGDIKFLEWNVSGSSNSLYTCFLSHQVCDRDQYREYLDSALEDLSVSNDR